MTFVIGDIHGEITKLKMLINNIYKIDKNADLIFVGDYINKGENSKKTLDFLIALKNSSFLIGNHEYYFLNCIKNNFYCKEFLKYAKQTTFIDFNIKTFKKDLIDKIYFPYEKFWNNLKKYYIIDDYFISHSGLNIKYLNGKYNIDILNELNEEDFIFNRYDFISIKNKVFNKITIFGHTGFNYPYYDGYKIGIDTSAVYEKSNSLTAFNIENSFFLNHKNQILYLSDINMSMNPWIQRQKPYRERIKGN